jgi:hypothetical protein
MRAASPVEAELADEVTAPWAGAMRSARRRRKAPPRLGLHRARRRKGLHAVSV